VNKSVRCLEAGKGQREENGEPRRKDSRRNRIQATWKAEEKKKPGENSLSSGAAADLGIRVMQISPVRRKSGEGGGERPALKKKSGKRPPNLTGKENDRQLQSEDQNPLHKGDLATE